MNRISDMNTVLNNSLAAIERVFDIVTDIHEKSHAKRLAHVKGRITFENVIFGYSLNQPVIKILNLDICPGEVVAPVGS